jgi:hypothetical protein
MLLWTARLALLLVATAKIGECSERHSDESSIGAKRKTRVILTPLYLRYIEDGRVLELAAEVLVDRTYLVYLPTPARWRRTMPEWAAERRDEIVAEMKRLTKADKVRWEEVD